MQVEYSHNHSVKVYAVVPEKKKKYLLEITPGIQILKLHNDGQNTVLKTEKFSYPLLDGVPIRRPGKSFYLFPLSQTAYYGLAFQELNSEDEKEFEAFLSKIGSLEINFRIDEKIQQIAEGLDKKSDQMTHIVSKSVSSIDKKLQSSKETWQEKAPKKVLDHVPIVKKGITRVTNSMTTFREHVTEPISSKTDKIDSARTLVARKSTSTFANTSVPVVRSVKKEATQIKNQVEDTVEKIKPKKEEDGEKYSEKSTQTWNNLKYLMSTMKKAAVQGKDVSKESFGFLFESTTSTGEVMIQQTLGEETVDLLKVSGEIGKDVINTIFNMQSVIEPTSAIFNIVYSFSKESVRSLTHAIDYSTALPEGNIQDGRLLVESFVVKGNWKERRVVLTNKHLLLYSTKTLNKIKYKIALKNLISITAVPNDEFDFVVKTDTMEFRARDSKRKRDSWVKNTEEAAEKLKAWVQQQKIEQKKPMKNRHSY